MDPDDDCHPLDWVPCGCRRFTPRTSSTYSTMMEVL